MRYTNREPTRLSVHLDEQSAKNLRDLAERKGTTVAGIVRDAIGTESGTVRRCEDCECPLLPYERPLDGLCEWCRIWRRG